MSRRVDASRPLTRTAPRNHEPHLYNHHPFKAAQTASQEPGPDTPWTGSS